MGSVNSYSHFNQSTYSNRKMMFKLALVMTCLLACSSASPLGFGLGAPLLPKVSYAPAEVTRTIQPEVTVQHPEYQYRSVPVPVPVAAPYHTEPVVHHYPLPSTYSVAAYPYAHGLHYAHGFPAVL